jgi:hypothetical protein
MKLLKICKHLTNLKLLVIAKISTFHVFIQVLDTQYKHLLSQILLKSNNVYLKQELDDANNERLHRYIGHYDNIQDMY